MKKPWPRMAPRDGGSPNVRAAPIALLLPLLLRVPRVRGVVLQIPLSFMAGEFQNVITLPGIASYGESDSPGAGIDGRIFDAGFVLDRVGIDRRVTLDDMEGIGGEVTRHVQPCFSIEIGHVDDKRVAFPSTDGISLPKLDGSRQMLGSFHTDVAVRMFSLVKDHEMSSRLNNLKSERCISLTRYT